MVEREGKRDLVMLQIWGSIPKRGSPEKGVGDCMVGLCERVGEGHRR